ncbi:MAG: hypothetical protein ABJB66_11520, partial [Gemmatimonadaceae bacterium]
MTELTPHNLNETKTSAASGRKHRPKQSAAVIATVLSLTVFGAAFMPRIGEARAVRSNVRMNDSTNAAATVRTTPLLAKLVLGESLLGRSKKLRVSFVSRARSMSLPILRELFGDTASTQPGLYATHTDDSAEPFHFITLHPFADKIAGRIGAYKIGFFPSEKRAARSVAYNNPEGFIEVSAANQFTRVSEHFTLNDFLTHDQIRVWPKYLVLKEPLLDKLELVIAELGRMGVPVNQQDLVPCRCKRL